MSKTPPPPPSRLLELQAELAARFPEGYVLAYLERVPEGLRPMGAIAPGKTFEGVGLSVFLLSSCLQSSGAGLAMVDLRQPPQGRVEPASAIPPSRLLQ